MYLIVFFIFAICIAIAVILFLNKPEKSKKTELDTQKGGKQFVFSKDKQFVASRELSKKPPAAMQSAKIKPETKKNKRPPVHTLAKIQPEIQKQAPQKQETPPETGPLLSQSEKKPKSVSSQNDLDFDRLEELIEDFFTESKNSDDFQNNT